MMSPSLALLQPTVTTQAVTAIGDDYGHRERQRSPFWACPIPPSMEWSGVRRSIPPPRTARRPTERSAAIGAFTSAITGLTPGTLYHVRAYATNDGRHSLR